LAYLSELIKTSSNIKFSAAVTPTSLTAGLSPTLGTTVIAVAPVMKIP